MLGNNIDRDVIYTRYYVRCVIFIIFFSVSPCVSCSVIPLFATPWTIAHQGPLSMGFSRQEYWSGLPFPPPGNLPDLGIKLAFLTSPALAGGFFTTSVQFSSVAQLCLILCDPVNRSTPGLPIHHQLPESTQTHVHRVDDAIQPSHPVSSPSPPALNLSQHQGLFQ